MLFPESHHGMVPHTHGISEARLRTTFEGAGLGAFAMKDAARVDINTALTLVGPQCALKTALRKVGRAGGRRGGGVKEGRESR